MTIELAALYAWEWEITMEGVIANELAGNAEEAAKLRKEAARIAAVLQYCGYNVHALAQDVRQWRDSHLGS